MPKVNDLKQFILMERQQRNNLAAFNLLTKKDDPVNELKGYLNSNNKRSNILHIDDLKYGQPTEADLKTMITRLKLLQTNFDELSIPTPFKNSSEEVDIELKFVRMLRKLTENPDTIQDIAEEDKDLLSPFLRFCQANHLPVDESFMRLLIDDINAITMRFKYMFNRPRPKQLAAQKDLELVAHDGGSAHSPAYPSAHTVSGNVIARALADKYPNFAEDFKRIGATIGLNRLIAGLHYPTDHAAGVMLADQIYAKGLVKDHTNFMMPESEDIVRAVQAAVTKHAEGFNLNKSIDDMDVLLDIFKAEGDKGGRLLITGGRDNEDYDAIKAAIKAHNPDVVIHGGAGGADSLAEKAANELGIPTEVYKPDWGTGENYDPSAGFKRNAEMLAESNPTSVMAFRGGKGTAHMVKIATDAGFNVIQPQAGGGRSPKFDPDIQGYPLREETQGRKGEQQELVEAIPNMKDPKYDGIDLNNMVDEDGNYIAPEKRIPLTDEQKKKRARARRLYTADHKAWLEEVEARPSRKGQRGFAKTPAQLKASEDRGTPGEDVQLSNMQAQLEVDLKNLDAELNDTMAARQEGKLIPSRGSRSQWNEDVLGDARDALAARIEGIKEAREARLSSGIGKGGSLTTGGQDLSGRAAIERNRGLIRDLQEGFLDERTSEELDKPFSRFEEWLETPAEEAEELEQPIENFYDKVSGATHLLVLEPADYRTTAGVDDYSGTYRLDPHDPENNSVGVQNPRGSDRAGDPVQQSTTRESEPVDVRGVIYDTATGEQLEGEQLIKYLHERGQSDYGLEQQGGIKTRGGVTVGEDRQWPSRLGSGHQSPGVSKKNSNSMVTVVMRQSRDQMIEDLGSDMAVGFWARRPEPDQLFEKMSDFDLLKTWVEYDQSKFATKQNPRKTMNTSAIKIKGTAYADKGFKQMSPEEMQEIDQASYDKLDDPVTGERKAGEAGQLQGVQSSLFGGRFTVGFVADKDRWNKLYDADTGMIAQLRALAKGYNTLKYGSEWVKYDKSAHELSDMRKAYQKRLDELLSNQEDEGKRISPEDYNEQKTFYEGRIRDTQEQQQALQLVSKKDSDPASLSYYADEIFDLFKNIREQISSGDSLPELHQMISMIDELHGEVFEKVTVDPTAPRAKSETEAEAMLAEYLDSSNYLDDVHASLVKSAEEKEAEEAEFLNTFQSQIDSLRAGDYQEGDGRNQSQVDVFFNGVRKKENNFEGDGGIFSDSVTNNKDAKEKRIRHLMFAAMWGSYSKGNEDRDPMVITKNMAGFLSQNWANLIEEVYREYDQNLLDETPDSPEPPEQPEKDLAMREDEAGDAFEARQNTKEHQDLDAEWAAWKAQVKDLSEKDREGVLEEWEKHRARPSKREYAEKINGIFLNPEHFVKDGKIIYKGQDIWRDMFLYPTDTDAGHSFIDSYSRPGGVEDKIDKNEYEKAVKKPGKELKHVSLDDVRTFARAVSDEDRTINNIDTFFAEKQLGAEFTGQGTNKLSPQALEFLRRQNHEEYRGILSGLADLEDSIRGGEFQQQLTEDSTLDPVAQKLREEIMNRVGKAVLSSVDSTTPINELQTDLEKPSFNLIQLVRSTFITDANDAKTYFAEEGKTLAESHADGTIEEHPLFQRGADRGELSYTAPNMIYGADETDMERNLFEPLDYMLFNSDTAFYPELSDENILGNEQLAARRGIIEDIIDEELKRDEEDRNYTDVRELGSNYDTSPEKYNPILQAVFKRVGDMKRDEQQNVQNLGGSGFSPWKLNTIPDAEPTENEAEAQTRKNFPVGRAPKPFAVTPDKDAVNHIEDMRRIDNITDEDIAKIMRIKALGATDASGKRILTDEKADEAVEERKERRDNWYFQTFGTAHTFSRRYSEDVYDIKDKYKRKWTPQPNVPRPENYRDLKTESNRKKYLDTEAYRDYGMPYDVTLSNTSTKLEKEKKRHRSLTDISPEELETYSSLIYDEKDEQDEKTGRKIFGRKGYYETVKEKLLETSINKIKGYEDSLKKLRLLGVLSGTHPAHATPNLFTYPTTWEDDYQNEHKISASEAGKQWKDYDSNEFSTRQRVVDTMRSIRTRVERGELSMENANRLINSHISATPRGTVEGVTKPAGAVEGRLPAPIQTTTREHPSPHSMYGTRFDEEDISKPLTRMGASREQESKNPTTSETLEGATTDVPASDSDPIRRTQRRFLRTQETDKRNERRRLEVVRAAQEGAGTKSKATTSSGGRSTDEFYPQGQPPQQLDLFTYAKLKPGQRTDEQQDIAADERKKALASQYTQRAAQDVVVQADKVIPPEGTS